MKDLFHGHISKYVYENEEEEHLHGSGHFKKIDVLRRATYLKEILSRSLCNSCSSDDWNSPLETTSIRISSISRMSAASLYIYSSQFWIRSEHKPDLQPSTKSNHGIDIKTMGCKGNYSPVFVQNDEHLSNNR